MPTTMFRPRAQHHIDQHQGGDIDGVAAIDKGQPEGSTRAAAIRAMPTTALTFAGGQRRKLDSAAGPRTATSGARQSSVPGRCRQKRRPARQVANRIQEKRCPRLSPPRCARRSSARTGHQRHQRGQIAAARPSRKTPASADFRAAEICAQLAARQHVRLSPLRAAEQPGRAEGQHQDQDREHHDVLVLDARNRPTRSVSIRPIRKPAQHGAGQRTDAAQHRGGERP